MIEIRHDELSLGGFVVGRISWAPNTSETEKKKIEYQFSQQREREIEIVREGAYDSGFEDGKSDERGALLTALEDKICELEMPKKWERKLLSMLEKI